jgi:peroxiredoxin Q/BCP
MRTFLMMAAIAWCSCGNAQTLKTGDQVPDFTLPDQDGHPFHLRDYVGKKYLVIYFYPKDESPVCTKEACSFRDNYDAFTKKGAMVIGINGGSVASHHSFQQSHQLPFSLLSDSANRVLKLFGVKGSFGLTGRKTFVVDRSGKIVYTFSAMLQGTKHEEEALAHIPGNP